MILFFNFIYCTINCFTFIKITIDDIVHMAKKIYMKRFIFKPKIFVNKYCRYTLNIVVYLLYCITV